MPKLICTGRDKVRREFEYTAENNPLDHTYDVMVQPVPATNGPSFELRLQEQDDSTWRIISVTHHGLAVYREKGIIDALIQALAEELGANIVSSPRKDEDDTGTFRTSAADKYWERLRGKGQATYDEARDVFTFSRPAKPKATLPGNEGPAADAGEKPSTGK